VKDGEEERLNCGMCGVHMSAPVRWAGFSEQSLLTLGGQNRLLSIVTAWQNLQDRSRLEEQQNASRWRTSCEAGRNIICERRVRLV
jgi:hypothetical protein